LRSPHLLVCLLAVPVAAAMAQTSSTNQGSSSAPVSYASVSQVNQLLTPLEQTSQQAQIDLARLRTDKWKTDSNTKHQTQNDIDSISRNLHSALPEIIAQLRAAPEDLVATFKLYRNLDALYDVFSGVVENAGAFGSKDDYEILGGDLSGFERSRRALADRMETLAGTKDAEIERLRGELRDLRATAAPAPSKKVVVDDTEPAPKPAKKKPAAKAHAGSSTASPKTPASQKPTGSTATPTQPPQPSPQQ
jgi:hypothetical protein